MAEIKTKYNVIKARDKLGLTQEQMASSLGVSRVSYNRYERGMVEIPVEKAKKLSMILYLSLEEIYEHTQEVPNE